MRRPRSQLDTLELRALFTGEHDERDAICEVHSGAGGTDAQDWTKMLLRMYLRWAERRGFDVEIDEVSRRHRGRASRSATFTSRAATRTACSQASAACTGSSASRRSTRTPVARPRSRRSTACPRSTRPRQPEIDQKDLRIDTYRSSGAGGQHVNVTDSAVRITHMPDRHRRVVPERALADAEQGEGDADPRGAARRTSAPGARAELERAVGRQARRRVRQPDPHVHAAPYQLVKDERTRYETGNVQAVLDGDLDGFIEAYLQWRRPEQCRRQPRTVRPPGTGARCWPSLPLAMLRCT